MTGPSSAGVSDVLSVLNKRNDILTYVVRGMSDRREMAKRATQSKTTVYRALEQLEEAGLVTVEDREYRPTELGRWASTRYSKLSEDMAEVIGHEKLVSDLQLPLEPDLFRSGKTIHSTKHTPHAANRALVEFVRSTSTVTAVTPTVPRDILDVIGTQVDTDDLSFRLVSSQPAIEALIPEYEPLLSNDGILVSERDAVPDIGLYRTETHAAIGALSESYTLQSLHISKEPTILSTVDAALSDHGVTLNG
ncbi:hypothetical protein [Haloarchaeobius sp. DYHT-AS-18]|uniref:transcriptional regulator FilR1 domain-containing protein n=1 Tax=Haloarchaeobius sp. DYHT-AS-18 TaxID=3446117 RepID=UPI003EB6A352